MKTKLLFALIVICGIVNGQTLNWQWAKSGRGAGHDYGNSISNDSKGNSFVTGYFEVPSITFGNDTLTGSINYHDHFYIVKYDNSGNELWAKSAGDQNNARGTCINTDSKGNSYVTGHFQGSGTINIGNITLTAPGSGSEGFLVKYDSSGNVLWAKTLGEANSVSNAIDASGNVYVTGGFFDSTATAIIRKFDNSGNLIWQQGATGNYTTPSICTDSSGNSYVTGCFMSTTMTFGSTTITNNSNGWIIFVVKYDSSGNVVWAKSEGTYGSLYIPSISTDDNGNCYVTGYFNGSYAKFGNIVLTNAGYENIFIVKLDNIGNVAWAKRAGGAGAHEGRCIKTDKNGNSYITGMFTGVSSFGNTNLFSVGGNDVFVAKYDSSGNVFWAQKAGGSNGDIGNGISIDTSGNSYITGCFFSPFTYFDGTVLTNCDTITNPAEIFVAKMGNNPTGIIEKNGRNEINIYPNPTSGLFNVQISQFENALINNIEIYNLYGECIHKQICKSANQQIDLSSLSSGIYLLQIKTQLGTIVKKIVKK